MAALCERCERGQTLCSAACRARRRRAQVRAAGARYQGTRRGARLHAARQARYRARRREEVTHPRSPSADAGATEGPSLPPPSARPTAPTEGARHEPPTPRPPPSPPSVAPAPARCARCSAPATGWYRARPFDRAPRPRPGRAARGPRLGRGPPARRRAVIAADKEAAILRLYHAEKWPLGTIARQVHVHPSTVRRVLAQHGVGAGRAPARPSMIEPFLPFVVETLTAYPGLRASRLYQMVKARGYPGAPDYFRSLVARYRPRPAAEAFLRLRTLPGEQAQADWAHFGHVAFGRAKRPLWAFVMVLSFSRRLFLSFSPSAAMPSFLRGHVGAFAAFGGVPRVVLYDNLKSAVLERAGDAIRFHPTLLALAGHYRFEPRPCAPARGNEKGRVERAIRYVRDAFFAGRAFADVAALNAEAAAWCEAEARERRCPGDRSRAVAEAFAEEGPALLALPDAPFDAAERAEVEAGKTPYVRFDLNDYSVPHDRVRRTLVVHATEARVRVLDGTDVVAEHARSWGRDEVVEDAAHVAALVAHKRRAREAYGVGRLHHAVPSSRALLQKAAADGRPLGPLVAGLVRLVEHDGAEAVEAAVLDALAHDAPHLGAVKQGLDRARHARGQPPPVRVALPPDPRLEGLVVAPHSLASYEQLGRSEGGEGCRLPRRRPTPIRGERGPGRSGSVAWWPPGTNSAASRGSSGCSRAKSAPGRPAASSGG